MIKQPINDDVIKPYKQHRVQQYNGEEGDQANLENGVDTNEGPLNGDPGSGKRKKRGQY